MLLCQIEILVDDIGKALDFYQTCFGWEACPAQMREYAFLRVPKESTFGVALRQKKQSFLDQTPENASSNSILYFHSARLPQSQSDEWVNLIANSGGKVLEKGKFLPGVGPVCFVQDPFGQIFGLILKEQ